MSCDVQQNWTHVNDKCVKHFTDPLSWRDANASCHAVDGRLVVFRTAQELNNVANSVLPSIYRVWIGLTDLETSRVWKWVDGTELTFNAWRAGEPSNVLARCSLFVNGQFYVQWVHNFNDDLCDNSRDFLCEKAP